MDWVAVQFNFFHIHILRLSLIYVLFMCKFELFLELEYMFGTSLLKRETFLYLLLQAASCQIWHMAYSCLDKVPSHCMLVSSKLKFLRVRPYNCMWMWSIILPVCEKKIYQVVSFLVRRDGEQLLIYMVFCLEVIHWLYWTFRIFICCNGSTLVRVIWLIILLMHLY